MTKQNYFLKKLSRINVQILWAQDTIQRMEVGTPRLCSHLRQKINELDREKKIIKQSVTYREEIIKP